MAVSETNKRILITLPREYADYLEQCAEKEHRSLSNKAAALLIDKINEEKRSKYLPYYKPRSKLLY